MGVAADVAIGILERHAAQLHAIRERGCRRRDVEEHRTREVVVQPVRGTNGGPSIAGDVPRHAHAGREVPPLGIQTRGAVRESRIARVDESGWRVDEPWGRDPLPEIVEHEIRDRAILGVRSEEGLPAHTTVERDAICGPPAVLTVETEVPLVTQQHARRAVPHERRLPGQEVGQSDAGRLAVEVEVPRGASVVLAVHFPVRGVAAERQLVPPTHDRQVVRHLVRLALDPHLDRVPARDGEPVGHVQPDHARHVRVKLDAEVLCIEELVGRIVQVVGRAVPGHAEPVDRVVAEHLRVAERRGLRARLLVGAEFTPHGQDVARA